MTFRDWLHSNDPDAQYALAVVTNDDTGKVYMALRRAFDAGRAAEAQAGALRALAAINAPLGREKH